MKKLLIILIFINLISLSVYAIPDNLLINGTLSIDSNSDGVADNWTWVPGSSRYIAKSIDAGSQKLDMQSNSSASPATLYQEVVSISNTAYSMRSLNYKVSGSVRILLMIDYYNNTTLISSSTGVYGESNVWSKIELTNLVTPGTCNKIRVNIKLVPNTSTSIGTLWVKDVECIQGDSFPTDTPTTLISPTPTQTPIPQVIDYEEKSYKMLIQIFMIICCVSAYVIGKWWWNKWNLL